MLSSKDKHKRSKENGKFPRSDKLNRGKKKEGGTDLEGYIRGDQARGEGERFLDLEKFG